MNPGHHASPLPWPHPATMPPCLPHQDRPQHLKVNRNESSCFKFVWWGIRHSHVGSNQHTMITALVSNTIMFFLYTRIHVCVFLIKVRSYYICFQPILPTRSLSNTLPTSFCFDYSLQQWLFYSLGSCPYLRILKNLPSRSKHTPNNYARDFSNSLSHGPWLRALILQYHF